MGILARCCTGWARHRPLLVALIVFEISIIHCAISVALPTSTSTQPVSDILASFAKQYNFPGMAAVVIHKNTIVAQGVTGVRALSDPARTPLTLNDSFHIGSDTKSMTAYMLAYMIQNYRLATSNGQPPPFKVASGIPLTWDTRVSDIFPGLVIHSGYANLTLRQLVTNRGGLPAEIWDLNGIYNNQQIQNNWNAYWIFQNAAQNNPVLARHNMMTFALARPPATQAGNYLYSNVSFIIAGHIIDYLLGANWDQMAKGLIAFPYGMYGSGYSYRLGFGAPGTPGVYNQPRGHHTVEVRDRYGNVSQILLQSVEPNSTNPTPDNPDMFRPAGGVNLPLSDWATYVNTFLQASRGQDQLMAMYANNPSINSWYQYVLPYIPWFKSSGPYHLSWRDFQALENPVTNPAPWYAMGWSVGGGLDSSGNVTQKILYHYGSNTLWSAVVWVDSTNDFAVLVVANSGVAFTSPTTVESASVALNHVVGTLLCLVGGDSDAANACNEVKLYPAMAPQK